MKIAIHQPNYLPYPGFFAKAGLCDKFVIYDTAQFTRGDFINRNRIRTFSFNGTMWLTLPVGKKKYEGVPITEVKIKDEAIFGEHGKTLKMMYSRALYYNQEVCDVVGTAHESLAEHNTFLIQYILQKLDMKPLVVHSSELNISIGHGTSGIIDIVKALNGTEYISGLGAKTYLEEERFKEESIALSYIAYEPLRYTQMHPGFVENTSIIDAIFNVGWSELEKALKNTKIQRQGEV